MIYKGKHVHDNAVFALQILRGLVHDWQTKGKAWPDYTLDHRIIAGLEFWPKN